MEKKEMITHASLFSGIGACELAAEWMGWTNVFNCEINPFCRKVLDYHFPKSIAYEDITKTDFRKWRGRIDVLTGGFPCQPFSCAGKRGGADDDRYLWPEMLRAIREVQPSWVVGENVAGILSMVQPGDEVEVGREASLFGEDDRTRVLLRQEYVVETVCRDLEREGYSVQPFVIPACAVGAPHRRDRVWFVARKVASDTPCNGDSGRPEEVCGETRGQDGKMYAESVKHGCVQTGASPNAASEGHVGRTAQTGGWKEGEPDRAFHTDFERPCGAFASADTNSNRRRNWEDKQEHVTQRERTSDNSIGSKDGPAADTQCRRGREVHDEVQSEQPNGERAYCHGREWDASSSNRKGRGIGFFWQCFPTTQPAVRGGDDGLPFDVDSLTIPFARWRQEAVKAYGNSMVPQVVYEIFRAIGNELGNEQLKESV